MKKLIYLFLTVLIVACSGEDGNGNSTNNTNNGNYFFEVEFGGVINRVQGIGGNESILQANQCYGGTYGVTLSITDITAENYVSGQNMYINMSFDNAQLGSNNGNLGVFPGNGGFYILEYLESIGVGNLTAFVENGPMSFSDGYNQRYKISNINLTDLGTSGGETIKGTYESVLYFQASVTADFDIPVPIRIEFSAIRL
jgi:hypothetical protein